MKGKIVKGIAGFYYVHADGSGTYECKAKGLFRRQNIKPLTGDNVEIAVIDEAEKTGNIEEIFPRKNELIRPLVVNIDMALVIFAAASPQPNLNLLDRFLVLMQYQQIPVTICFNKMELLEETERQRIAGIYAQCGYPVLFISVQRQEGIEELKAVLRGKTTAACGPSGVGKSSLVNLLQPEASMETGEISRKIQRGKQTTRHTQLIHIEENTYLMDTPGFSSVFVFDMEPEELKTYFPEFRPYEDSCKFLGCVHMGEQVCGVKEAAKAGHISRSRYKNYRLFYEELKEKRRY